MKKFFFLFTISALFIAVFTTCKKDISVTGIKLDETSVVLGVGESKMLIVTIFPENATNQIVTWISSNPLVASVTQNGLVKALSRGTAIIEVSTIDGKFSAKCTVKIDAPDEFEEFCPFINVDNIANTYPIINKFFEEQLAELSDTEKLNEFVIWLKSQYCIVDASIKCESCISGQPRQSEILFYFIENEIVKDFVFDVSMSNPLKVVYHHFEYEPKNVTVKMKNYVTIYEVILLIMK